MLSPSKNTSRLFAALTLVLATFSQAQLPSFQETPWLGYFAYGEDKTMLIKVSEDGDISAHPLNKKKEAGGYLHVPFKFTVRKELPNGRLVPLTFDAKSLQSKQKISSDLEACTITGEAGDGATFEITLEFKRDTLTLGGRVTGTGNEKHPLSFHYQSRLHHFHGRLLERVKGDLKEFEKIVGKDWIELQRHDKKKTKLSLVDPFEKETAETLNGPGCAKIEVQANIVDKKKRILSF